MPITISMNVVGYKHYLVPFGIAMWIVLVLAGLWKITSYANTPGEKADAQSQFPIVSQVATQSGKSTLILFLHPKCGCSKATMYEFSKLIPNIASHAQLNIVFLKPEGFSEQDVKSELWDDAQKLNNVTISIDSTQTESHLFGAKTSGQTFLYSPNGHLVFEGGITPSRGHTGEAAGQDQILNYFKDQTIWSLAPVASNTPVFGCKLASSDAVIGSQQ